MGACYTNIRHTTEVVEIVLHEVSFDVFDASEEKKRSVAMTVINIGELAKHLSHDFTENDVIPELKYAARTRDVYVHGYATLSFPMVYQTATESLPNLKVDIQRLLK
jgi:uncharacterized protein with HEPN domain